jgi:hypothetical protein
MANSYEQVAAKARGTVQAVKAGFNGLRGVFLHLAEEHGEVGSLIKRVRHSSDGSVRRDHWPHIRNELLSHERAERQAVYPLLENFDSTRRVVAQHTAEANQLEDLITRIEVMDPNSAAWGTAFEQLAVMVEQHVEEEEGDFFLKAQIELGEDEAEAVLSRYEAAKKAARAELRP